jgi:signal transduction histidine kinase
LIVKKPPRWAVWCGCWCLVAVLRALHFFDFALELPDELSAFKVLVYQCRGGVFANEFDSAVIKIKSLRDSRQLFLRNIMHELKTPITKGKLAAEMIEDATYTSILQNVFKRQEALLEEFSRIEKLSADELKLDIKRYHIEDVVDYALDILDDKHENITCHLTPVELKVDFELFGVVLKNLLDNGVNYAHDNELSYKVNKSYKRIS